MYCSAVSFFPFHALVYASIYPTAIRRSPSDSCLWHVPSCCHPLLVSLQSMPWRNCLYICTLCLCSRSITSTWFLTHHLSETALSKTTKWLPCCEIQWAHFSQHLTWPVSFLLLSCFLLSFLFAPSQCPFWLSSLISSRRAGIPVSRPSYSLQWLQRPSVLTRTRAHPPTSPLF